jgi:hypothetical protein
MVIVYYVSVILVVLDVYMIFFNKARMTGRWPFVLSILLVMILSAPGPVSQLVGADTWHEWLTNPTTRDILVFGVTRMPFVAFIIASALTVGGLWHDGDLRRSYTWRR